MAPTVENTGGQHRDAGGEGIAAVLSDMLDFVVVGSVDVEAVA